VASRSGTLQRHSPDGDIERELRLPGPLLSASVAPDGTLWIGGDGEVFRVAGDSSVDRFGPAANVPRGLVRDVLADPDGTLWIGTYGGGLGRLRDGRATRLTSLQGMPDNSISRILPDGRGRMWLSTNRGVAVIERSELDEVADGHARMLAPAVLGTERGVDEANFGSPAGFVTADGQMWFGTIGGAVTVDAAAFPFNTTPPVVRIEGILGDDRPLPLGATVEVPALTARLRLGFTALAPLYPERMRFRFRVDGVDPDWVDAGSERTLSWSPPGPGRYRFFIEARNEDGIWSATPATVELDVHPAWWQTMAFRVAGVLGLVLAAAAAVRRRIRGIESRHAERLRALEEQRQAEERMASVRAQLEHVSRVALAGELAASLAHEIRQPIGAIVNNAQAGKRNLEQYLRQPAELEQIFGDIAADGLRASEVLQGLRGFLRSRGPDAERLDLSSVVREMLPLVRRELQDNRVAVELSLHESLPPVEGLRVQLGQVVVNLVVNACEALSARDGERHLTVSTRERDGSVELEVRDNGPGLDPAVAARVFEPFVTTKPEGLGVGLAICRSIAERHGGHLSADTAPGGGLRMTLTLPAARPSEAGS
jgi:signal transduction histidine kinase